MQWIDQFIYWFLDSNRGQEANTPTNVESSDAQAYDFISNFILAKRPRNWTMPTNDEKKFLVNCACSKDIRKRNENMLVESF